MTNPDSADTLVERLEKSLYIVATSSYNIRGDHYVVAGDTLREAADTISTLQARVAELEKFKSEKWDRLETALRESAALKAALERYQWVSVEDTPTNDVGIILVRFLMGGVYDYSFYRKPPDADWPDFDAPPNAEWQTLLPAPPQETP